MRPKGFHLSLNCVTGNLTKLELIKNKTKLSVLWALYGGCVLCTGSPLFCCCPFFRNYPVGTLFLAFASIFFAFLTFPQHLWLAYLTFPIATIVVSLWYGDLLCYFTCTLVLLLLSLSTNKTQSLYLWNNGLYFDNQSNSKIRVKLEYSLLIKTGQTLNIHCLVNYIKFYENNFTMGVRAMEMTKDTVQV